MHSMKFFLFGLLLVAALSLDTETEEPFLEEVEEENCTQVCIQKDQEGRCLFWECLNSNSITFEGKVLCFKLDKRGKCIETIPQIRECQLICTKVSTSNICCQSRCVKEDEMYDFNTCSKVCSNLNFRGDCIDWICTEKI